MLQITYNLRLTCVKVMTAKTESQSLSFQVEYIRAVCNITTNVCRQRKFNQRSYAVGALSIFSQLFFSAGKLITCFRSTKYLEII